MMPEVTQFMYTDPVITDESQKIWFRSIEYNDKVLYWIITFDNVDIGLLSITKIDYNNKRCDWAYYIADSQFQGKGIGRNLECNIYDFVFYTLELNKLCCEVMSNNYRVVEIHQHFGSSVEGKRVEHIWKDDECFDIYEMAITKSKWDQIKSSYTYEKIEIEYP